MNPAVVGQVGLALADQVGLALAVAVDDRGIHLEVDILVTHRGPIDSEEAVAAPTVGIFLVVGTGHRV